jgi:hypothetical protein
MTQPAFFFWDIQKGKSALIPRISLMLMLSIQIAVQPRFSMSFMPRFSLNMPVFALNRPCGARLADTWA